MKILFLGDIVASSGRALVKQVLPAIKEEYNPNLVIANAENLSHGNGFTPEHLEEMQQAGINFFTLGDHTWGNTKGVMKLNDHKVPIIRPANYPDFNTPGRGYAIVEDNSMNRILIINLLGRVFMKNDFDCPFRAVDRILRETAHEYLNGIFVDFHAEATSEKYALAFYLDGRVSAVLGTHTHVATADARILEGGTAAMSDAGMNGSLDSVIGVRKDIIINGFLSQRPAKHDPETSGRMIFNSVLIELDIKTKKALNIQHIQKII